MVCVSSGIKITGRNFNNLRYADNTTLMAERASWWGWKRRVKKTGLKLNIEKTKIMAFSPFTSWQIDGVTVETVSDFIFLGLQNHCRCGDCSHEIKRHLLLGRKVMTNLDSILQKQRHYFANKGPSSQGYGFSSGYVWMWELDCEESWVPKNRCFWTVVLEKTLESYLDCKEIQPVHSEGDYWPGITHFLHLI